MRNQLLILLAFAALAWPSVAQDPTPPPAARPTLPDIDACTVIARIDGEVVLAGEMMWQVNLIVEDNRDRIPPDQLEAARAQILAQQLRGIVDQKLLYSDFRRKSPTADMKLIAENLDKPFRESELPKLRKSFSVTTNEELETKLQSLGTSIAERRQAFLERAVSSQWLREQIKTEKVTHIDMVEYYRAHVADYEFPTQARWEELMVRYDRQPDRASARQKLAELGNMVWPEYQAATDKTQPIFAATAKAKSDGFTAADGGIYDWTTEGALRDPLLDQAIFLLPVGTMSPILESELGVHIIRVLERKQAGRTEFGVVQEKIREKIENERFSAAADVIIGKLRETSRVWTIFTGDTSATALLGKPGDKVRR